MPIITQAQARTLIPSLTSDDDDLGDLIDRIEVAMAQYLGFPISEGTNPRLYMIVTLYNDGEGGAMRVDGNILRLGVRPVGAVVVVQDHNQLFDGDPVDESDYIVEPVRGIVRLLPSASVSWYTGERSIRVTCELGWDDIPADLRQAAIETVAHNWRRRGIDATENGSSDRKDVVFPGVALNLMAPHRLVAGWVA